MAIVYEQYPCEACIDGVLHVYLLASPPQRTHQLFLEARDFDYCKTVECSDHLAACEPMEAFSTILKEVDVDDLVSKVPVTTQEVITAVVQVTKGMLIRKHYLQNQ